METIVGMRIGKINFSPSCVLRSLVDTFPWVETRLFDLMKPKSPEFSQVKYPLEYPQTSLRGIVSRFNRRYHTGFYPASLQRRPLHGASDSINAKPRLECGVCKFYRSRKGDLLMVLLMLLVSLIIRLRRLGVKIDFWF